ncbi:MAG TPA: hypothetical protein VFS00_06405 [Polyangiaceae bacterium]|nr:hypothetical protein [Polyangiaceae bacterium]
MAPPAPPARSNLGRALLAAALATSLAPAARAAPPWVERHLVLPRHDFAFDVGLGVGHHDYYDNDIFNDNVTGVGFNLEGAVGITEHLELGFRTGLRFADEGRGTAADLYGRLWDTDSYNLGNDTLANPEARLRYGFLRGDVVELGLEARFYLPITDGSEFGVAPGLPVTFHFGDVARLDTGVLVPIIFTDDVTTIVSFPARLWFQATPRLWLGPISGVRIVNYPGGGSDTQVPLGFGLGYQISSAVDLKTQFLFPDVDRSGPTDRFGAGLGLQFRVE